MHRYPSVTASAGAAVYTGPSVESVSSPTSSSFSGGRLAAAVAIPILALAGLLAAYIIWNKSKKKPEKKRWSQAIDQRMSMMSQGSGAPRPSMSSSARPTSMYDPSRPSLGHRPSASLHSVNPNSSSPLRNSTFVGGADISPTKSQQSNANSPLAPRRPLSTATAASTEMRQIGQGERMSRVSFAGERPVMVGGREKSNRTSFHGRKSIGSAVRTSMAGSMVSIEPEAPSPPPKSEMARSETTEELSTPLVPGRPAYRRAPSSQKSASSSLRQEVSGSHNADVAISPFADSSSNPLPKPALAIVASHMPMAKRNSMLSPDEAMASYHASREVPPLPLPASKSSGSIKRPQIGRSASMTFLRSASGRILKSLQKEKSGLGSTNEDSEDGPIEGSTDVSPFNDPDSPLSSINHSSHNDEEKSPFDSSRDNLTPSTLPRSFSNTPIAERFATTQYAASTRTTPSPLPSPPAVPTSPPPTNRHLSAALPQDNSRASMVESVYSQDGGDVEPAPVVVDRKSVIGGVSGPEEEQNDPKST